MHNVQSFVNNTDAQLFWKLSDLYISNFYHLFASELYIVPPTFN